MDWIGVLAKTSFLLSLWKGFGVTADVAAGA